MTEKSRVRPVIHPETFWQMWDNSSEQEPIKPPVYLVRVTTIKPRWSKCALARSTIAGLITSMDLIGSGKYPLAGLIVTNKLNTFLHRQNSPQPLHRRHTMVVTL